MTEWARARKLRLHRSTLVVLLLTLSSTLLGAGITRGLVQQSEDRVLRQQTAQAGLVLASVLNQTTGATNAFASTLLPDGSVDQARFAGTAAALAQASGISEGYSAIAVVDLAAHKVLAVSGAPVLDLASAKGQTAMQTAAARGSLALVSLSQGGDRRALGMLAPVSKTAVVYVEMPLTETSVYVPDLPGKPFAGVDFAVYFGAETSANLIMTNSRTLPLSGQRAHTAVGVTINEAWEESGTDTAGKLLLVMHPRAPLTGRTAAVMPWVMLALGLSAGLAVLVLLEKSQRRRDEALRLVRTLEERNQEVQEAVERQARAEERLRQAQRLEAVGQLAGGIAHDFNNLLAVIFSYTGFLRTAAEGQPWLEDVDEVDKAARRAAELTQQLLMFSRRDLARPDVMDVRALLADRQRLLQRTLSDDIDVVLDIPDHPLQVRADSVELDQVIMNLAVNARDAMPNGGTLALALDELPDDGDGAQIRLRVTDTGLGMDEETKEHAFEPFFTTKEVGRGTGLGLATVYGIVTRWGGSVALGSTRAVGTTVTVLLPRCDDALIEQEIEPAGDTRRGAGRVLLVEDEESVRKASRRILTEAGFEVVEAKSGPEALDKFDEQRIDVLVSDVVMPGGLSGVDLAERLWLIKPDLPVVLASGYGGEHLSRRSPLPDGTQLLRKPFAAQTLVDAVRRSLDAEGALT